MDKPARGLQASPGLLLSSGSDFPLSTSVEAWEAAPTGEMPSKRLSQSLPFLLIWMTLFASLSRLKGLLPFSFWLQKEKQPASCMLKESRAAPSSFSTMHTGTEAGTVVPAGTAQASFIYFLKHGNFYPNKMVCGNSGYKLVKRLGVEATPALSP